MNVTDIEALLTRVDVTYSYGTLSELERRMRIEEWLDSAVAAFDWQDVGRLAWRRWKDQRDRAPTPHAFAEVCRQVLTAQRLDRPRLPEGPVTDEQREQNVRLVREAKAAMHYDEAGKLGDASYVRGEHGDIALRVDFEQGDGSEP